MSDEGKLIWRVRRDTEAVGRSWRRYLYGPCAPPEQVVAGDWQARAEAAEARIRELVELIEPKMGTINFYMGPGARVAIGLESKEWFKELRKQLNEARAALNPPAEDDPTGLVPMDGMKHQIKMSADEERHKEQND